MNLLAQLTAQQLRTAANIKEKIDSLKKQLEGVLAIDVSAASPSAKAARQTRKGKKRFSAEARAQMAAAQRARRARERGEIVRPVEHEAKETPAEKPVKKARKKRRVPSPST